MHLAAESIDIATALPYHAVYHDNTALSCLKMRHKIAMTGLEDAESFLCGALAEHRGVPLEDVRADVDAGGEIDSLEATPFAFAQYKTPFVCIVSFALQASSTSI